MRYSILSLVGVTLSFTTFAGSVMAIPNFFPVQEPKRLSDIDISSLWTSHPVAVDKSQQNFERLPALVVQRTPTANLDEKAFTFSTTRSVITRDEIANIDQEGELNASSNLEEFNGQIAAWCSQQYRSYRLSDNTYQPYTGARRQCQPPFAASVQTASNELPLYGSGMAGNSQSEDSHVEWCSSRYRSYNLDDNTYRAFSGEIRSCVSPYI